MKHKPEDIVFLEAYGSYVIVWLTDGRRTVHCRGLSYWQRLYDNRFVRIHHSFLVNRQAISSINISKRTLRLYCDIELPISRRKVKSIKDAMRILPAY